MTDAMKRNGFDQTELGEVLNFFNGKAIKPGGDGEYAAFGSNGLIGRSPGYTHEDGIIIGRVGAYCGSIAYCGGRFWASDNTIVAKPKQAIDDIRYFSYLLRDLKLNGYAGGAAQPLVTHTVLKRVPALVALPKIQKQIAAILSAYDDLIDNNTRRIQILERMAQALYREWFVSFRFPGHAKVKLVESPLGKIPQGWEVKQLKDVANVTYGFPFQSNKFNTTGVGTPVIRIRNILDGSTDTLTDEKAEPKYHIKNGDILVGTDGDFHMCIWSSGHALQNQRVAKFESSGEIGNYHLFLALELPIQTWNKSIVGTTVAHLGDMHIKTIQFAWPPATLLTEARNILEPMSDQIITLKRKNANLRRTRDLLLPKLISGDLDVSKLDLETGK